MDFTADLVRFFGADVTAYPFLTFFISAVLFLVMVQAFFNIINFIFKRLGGFK